MAVHHPAYEKLHKHAMGGCPVKTGRNCTKKEIHAAVMRGPRESALAEEAISYFTAESKEKAASNQASLVCYEILKGNLPTKMKVHQLRQSLTSQKHSDQYWTCHFH